jgi:hypothetical protein
MSDTFTFHLLISHLGYIGLGARMFDNHFHQIVVRIQINVYILVYLFDKGYLPA